ncbi:hypothetical protein RIF29_12013 [Crotalaria pallida]|uniref:DRBM domain-containing protein n=1 Tax=Crotalaria pallida TaxID=3830 RepID=A0AAN9IMW2_CROPI
MLTNDDLQGVSKCYVFKSRLQEYAQKVGLPTPVYETTKEGPSHEPCFRSTVIVNEVRYDSLPGFFNRKAAEQSAAEVALVELAKSNEVNQSITQPVHETGLCKNLLQEYAQKMNYAMPLYQCKKDDLPGRASMFTCTVDIGGILYIGGAAKTKKEAEIKAARTALLAIQTSQSHASQNQSGHSQLTVLPGRKRTAESAGLADETSNTPKPKKSRFKRKASKNKHLKDKKGRVRAENVNIGANVKHEGESLANVNDESRIQEMKSELLPSEAVKNFENGISVEKETLAGEGISAQNSQGIFENGKSTELHGNGKSTELHSNENNIATVASEVCPVPKGDIPEMTVEMNKQRCNGETVSDK